MVVDWLKKVNDLLFFVLVSTVPFSRLPSHTLTIPFWVPAETGSVDLEYQTDEAFRPTVLIALTSLPPTLTLKNFFSLLPIILKLK